MAEVKNFDLQEKRFADPASGKVDSGDKNPKQDYEVRFFVVEIFFQIIKCLSIRVTEKK